VIPFLVMLVMFAWGTKLYFQNYTPPRKDTLDIYVVGKQWMWKVQYPDGQREIDELHVPTGRTVKLTLASEDVIHSFFIPAFRLKHDVVPGSYETYWFEATQPGRYHIFCAEYCGTNHSEMKGWVTVMSPNDYQAWLRGGAPAESMAEQGHKLFAQYGCVTCHVTDQQGRAPALNNVFGHPVELEDGRTVIADEAFLRESILNPNAKIAKGYLPNIMPAFQDQIKEDGLLQLIVYIKSLSGFDAAAKTTSINPAGAIPPAKLAQKQ
jgi:cytochrome c oxidase subunit 2